MEDFPITFFLQFGVNFDLVYINNVPSVLMIITKCRASTEKIPKTIKY